MPGEAAGILELDLDGGGDVTTLLGVLFDIAFDFVM